MSSPLNVILRLDAETAVQWVKKISLCTSKNSSTSKKKKKVAESHLGIFKCALSHSCDRFNFLGRYSSFMGSSGLVDRMHGFLLYIFPFFFFLTH